MRSMRSRTPYPCSSPSDSALRMRRSRVPGRSSAWSGINVLLCDLGESLATLSSAVKENDDAPAAEVPFQRTESRQATPLLKIAAPASAATTGRHVKLKNVAQGAIVSSSPSADDDSTSAVPPLASA